MVKIRPNIQIISGQARNIKIKLNYKKFTMMKSIIASVIVLISLSSFAQNPNDAIIVFSGGSMRTMDIKSKPKETKGSYYYNDKWYNGTIKLFSGEEVQAYPLKYDMKMNQIDIKVNNTIKVISIGAVKEITWLKPNGKYEILKNLSIYKDLEGYGFLSVLSEGKLSLLKKTELNLLDANYNTAMDVGSQSDKYVKKEIYYIKSGDEIIQIKKKKKNILNKFEDKAEKVELFASENNLNFKDDVDLEKIFNYYNSL